MRTYGLVVKAPGRFPGGADRVPLRSKTYKLSIYTFSKLVYVCFCQQIMLLLAQWTYCYYTCIHIFRKGDFCIHVKLVYIGIFFYLHGNICDNVQYKGLKLLKRLAIDGKTYQSLAGYIQASDFPFRWIYLKVAENTDGYILSSSHWSKLIS